MSLSSHPVGPVIPVSDLEASRGFYEDKLGLEGEPTPGGYLVRAAGGTVIYLLDGGELAGKADWPLASFESDDLAAAVASLRENGVEFLSMSAADGDPFDADERGISAQEDIAVAWMLDPDGQVLTVFERS